MAGLVPLTDLDPLRTLGQPVRRPFGGRCSLIIRSLGRVSAHRNAALTLLGFYKPLE